MSDDGVAADVETRATDMAKGIHVGVAASSEYSRQFGDPKTVESVYDRRRDHLNASSSSTGGNNATYNIHCAKNNTSTTAVVPSSQRRRIAPSKKSEYDRQFYRDWSEEQQSEFENNKQIRRDRKFREFQSHPLEWAELTEDMNALLLDVTDEAHEDPPPPATPPPPPTAEARAQRTTTITSKAVRKALGIKNGDSACAPDQGAIAGQKSRRASVKQKSGKDVLFASFGQNNTGGATPGSYMKTHNVKAPSTQLVPFTSERVARARAYDENRKMRRQRYYERTQAERLANLKKTAPESDNKTEYQRHFCAKTPRGHLSAR